MGYSRIIADYVNKHTVMITSLGRNVASVQTSVQAINSQIANAESRNKDISGFKSEVDTHLGDVKRTTHKLQQKLQNLKGAARRGKQRKVGAKREAAFGSNSLGMNDTSFF